MIRALMALWKFNLKLLCAALIAAPASAGNLQLAEQQYKLGNYEKTRQFCLTEIISHPGNAGAHYLLGNALLQLSRKNEAIREYQAAINLEPDSTAGKYSRAALAGLMPPPKPAAVPAPSAGTQGGALGSTKPAALQAHDSDQGANLECDAKVRDITRDADNRVKQLQQEMDEKIAANGQPLTTLRNASGFMYQTTYYDPGPANNEIKKEYLQKIDQIKADASRRVDEIKAFYKKRQQ